MYYFTNSPPKGSIVNENQLRREDEDTADKPSKQNLQPAPDMEASKPSRKRRRASQSKVASPEIPREREKSIEPDEVSFLDCNPDSVRDERQAETEEEKVSVSNLQTRNSFQVLSDLPTESVHSCDILSWFDDDKDSSDTPSSSLPVIEDPRTPESQTEEEANPNRICTLCESDRVSERYHVRCRECFKMYGPP